jgi:hypothetical protein
LDPKIIFEKTDSSFLRILVPKILFEKTYSSFLRISDSKSYLRKPIAVS